MSIEERSPTGANPATALPARGSFGEVLLVFTRLGLISFGGPVAHLGYFRQELVNRRGWLDDQTYADLVALCQFLPGPASSQVGMALGIRRAGLPGALAAWLGFTLPSAAVMILFAYGLANLGSGGPGAGWLHGLQVAAVAVVALAVWSMAKTLCPDRPRATLAVVAAVATLAWPVAAGQVLIIALAGVIGRFALTPGPPPPPDHSAPPVEFAVGPRLAITCWVIFVVLLVGLPLVRPVVASQPLAVFDSFYRTGSLVFGGGHVAMPLLQAEVVPPGWVSNEQFVAGYGAVQAVPGPLFTFSAYLGAIMALAPNGWAGGLLALVAVFLPSFLLVTGSLPFWNFFRARPDFQAALRGINAAVVGLLLAALYQPVWVSAIRGPLDFGLGLIVFGLLAFWKWPPWAVVGLAAVGGAGLSLL